MKIKYFGFLILFTFAFTTNISAQKKSKKIVITGVVKDSLGNPVNEATVYVEDSSVKKTTNKDGEFKIKVKETPKTIYAFSEHYGLSSSEDFDENKVTIEFDSTSEEKGKAFQLEALKKVKKRKPEVEQYFTSIYDYLRVKVPQVRVSGSNEIRVRGSYNTTLSSNEDPLIIVNGHPTSTAAFGDLTPNNIKNINVLKSSEAASYGVRGANGVILVTTK
ncbi:TonB-dependent receptor plug domain-containing protein [uncultured Winogradskyella sp.]|uniref:TonB-dependent receptor plug domain-containing protein n=1 Tax=Winogradskyella sp. 4-2091 TaxID=3381659 RepID=UPI0026378A3C|nr:TonB-dependent receptor plug domain-containing protein [uncultured Winogradskyella sp.]